MLFFPQLLISVKRTMEDANISAMILKQATFVPAIQDIHCKRIDIVALVSFDSYRLIDLHQPDTGLRSNTGWCKSINRYESKLTNTTMSIRLQCISRIAGTNVACFSIIAEVFTSSIVLFTLISSCGKMHRMRTANNQSPFSPRSTHSTLICCTSIHQSHIAISGTDIFS